MVEDFVRCKRKVVIYDAYFVKRIKESCVLKCVWICFACENEFHKMNNISGHSTNCPSCGVRLVLNVKNKWER